MANIDKIRKIEGIVITESPSMYIVEMDSMLQDMGILTDKPLKEASKRLGLPIKNDRIVIDRN